jgi:hypothetical protein
VFSNYATKKERYIGKRVVSTQHTVLKQHDEMRSPTSLEEKDSRIRDTQTKQKKHTKTHTKNKYIDRYIDKYSYTKINKLRKFEEINVYLIICNCLRRKN